MKKKIIVDCGYWAWNKAYSRQPSPWETLDALVEGGAILALDSKKSIRKEYLPWYKANRKIELTKEAQELKERSIELTQRLKYRYPSSQIAEIEGMEADDVISFTVNPGDSVMGIDKDFLTIDCDFHLIDVRFKRWGVERIKTDLPIKRGKSFLAYQLLYGDAIDNVPRLLGRGDTYIAKWCFEGENPLQRAIDVLPPDKVRESLFALMIPSPLIFGNVDPIEYALKE